MRPIVVGLLLLFAACGKVGDPLPPFIRIPEPVKDLTAVQSGYDLILTWTNPGRNIDGSAATDLQRIRIYSGGAPVTAVDVNAPGQTQSYLIPARPLIGAERTFAVQAATKAEKLSAISNSVSVTPVEVPGQVTALRSVVDQNRIILEWDLPRENPELANVYIVVKSGGVTAVGEPVVVTERKFQDELYQEGTTYSYNITPVRRRGEAQTPGLGETIMVLATDTTPPQVPTGMEIVASDDGAFLIWTPNSESDLAGYQVFRSDRADAGFIPLTEKLQTTYALFDRSYRPGVYYAVSSADESGNESRMSVPYRAP